MKKIIAICEILFVLCVALACAPAAVEDQAGYSGAAGTGMELSFRLPASLQTIEEEAFESTAIVSVELPDALKSIGDRAFANVQTLLTVKIPAATKAIAGTAFAGSDSVTILGAPNSYARAFARENGLPFRAVMVMLAGSESVHTAARADTRGIITEIKDEADGGGASSQWRPVEEIKAEQYDQYIANNIVGRAPPACA